MAAAVVPRSDVVVRAPRPGEGTAVAKLWKELWDIHTEWGGYPGTQDVSVYEGLARRLDDDAITRNGEPIQGHHLHVVAVAGTEIVGQVEGWMDRHGFQASTPYTCEVRSLIVSARARATGAGRALLDELARIARYAAGGPVVMAAEVLEPNPAHAFYARVGYHPIGWTARIETHVDPASIDARSGGRSRGRAAGAFDALPIALLDGVLATRRRSQRDLRFDGPRPIEATLTGAIATHLAATRREPSEFVAVDGENYVQAAGSLAVMALDPPFLPTRRALLGRISVDPAVSPIAPMAALVRIAVEVARGRGARGLEITDLSGPGTPMHDAALLAGARPWSRIVAKNIDI